MHMTFSSCFRWVIPDLREEGFLLIAFPPPNLDFSQPQWFGFVLSHVFCLKALFKVLKNKAFNAMRLVHLEMINDIILSPL